MTLWGDLLQEPVFVMTGDQDWSPTWAVDAYIKLCATHGIPAHLFCTQPCSAVERGVAESKLTVGWHPNFFPGSSQGSSVEEVTSYMVNHFPGARTARTHCFSESTFTSVALAAAGIRVDSQVATSYQSHLTPLLHWTGVLRLPVFFEDDIFFGDEAPALSLEGVLPFLFSPGLKILNFHPTFVSCNIPSREYYDAHKTQIFDADDEPVVFQGRGTRDIFLELTSIIAERGYRFVPFLELVARLTSHLRNNRSAFPPSFLTKFFS